MAIQGIEQSLQIEIMSFKNVVKLKFANKANVLPTK